MDRTYVNMGGKITTAASTGIAGANVAQMLLQADPLSEPCPSEIEKSHEGFSGVVLIGSLAARVLKGLSCLASAERLGSCRRTAIPKGILLNRILMVF